MKQDVIVIGAGLAGMVAALSASREGARVLLVSRTSIGMGSNSAMSNGVFTGPSETYDPEDFVKDTFEIGKGLNDIGVLRQVAREARSAITSLRSFGVTLKETHGRYIVQPQRPDVIRGVSLVQQLAGHVNSVQGIHPLTGFCVTDILVQADRAVGICGFDAAGKDASFFAPSVVLAAGGAGALYLKNDNQKGTMGHGYALAARAGVCLWDMEFVQFYPMVFDEPHMPQVMLYPGFPKEARLANAAGEDISRKYGLADLHEAIRTKRDAFSEIVYSESKSGPVCMDLRGVPEHSWNAYPLSLLRKIKFDFKQKPVRIMPGAHYLMGGVRIDKYGQTDVKGLFACGEVVWGLHGANRRGGNALTECAVYGRIAGRSAADFSQNHPCPQADAQAAPAHPVSPLQGESLRELRSKIRKLAWHHAGITRSAGRLEEGAEILSDIESSIQRAVVQSAADRKHKTDLLDAALVLKAIFSASLGRRESRGAFNREDFPETDNRNWLKNSCLTYDSNRRMFECSYHPVSADH